MHAPFHVLIVDDDSTIRAVLRAAVLEVAQDIREAPDGCRALHELRASEVPLVVLLDWRMPELDGLGVLRAVAAEPRLAATHRFVLITADGAPDGCESARLLDDLQVPVIRKPFDLGALLNAVAQVTAREPGTR